MNKRIKVLVGISILSAFPNIVHACCGAALAITEQTGTLGAAIEATTAAVSSAATANTGNLELIEAALIGTNMQANLHSDLNNVAIRIDNMSTSIGTALTNMQKSVDIARKKAIYAKEDIQRLPSSLERTCQAIATAATSENISAENSLTSKAKVKLAETYSQARRKTMRDPKKDRKLQVAEHKDKYCSETDAKAGICEVADICADDDNSCKANADQSAALFLVTGYSNKAHEEGAREFISHIVNPYPSVRPKKSTLEGLGDASAYKYDAIVGESRMSVSESILIDLWSDRANIFNDKSMQTYLNEGVSADDNQIIEATKFYKNKVFNPATKPSFMEKVMMDSAWFLNLFPGVNIDGEQAIISDNEAQTGAISRLEFFDLQVNSMYGNTSFMNDLGANDGRSFQALGKALALNNKLQFEIMKRMDKLIFLSAVSNARGGHTASKSGVSAETR